MIDHARAQRSLLAVWEQGARERQGRRALTLSAAAAPAARAEDDPSAATIGCRDAALLDLREQLFGRGFTAVSSCPSCRQEIELAFDIAEVRRGLSDVVRADIHAGGVNVQFRLPTGLDLAAIESAPDVESARALLLARCVERAARNEVALAVDDLPPEILDATTSRMCELDPQADVALDVECPSCRHAWREPFDIVSYLWSEIAVWARRLLDDVHVLASTYGWTEDDILRLTPARRHAYLEMIR